MIHILSSNTTQFGRLRTAQGASGVASVHVLPSLDDHTSLTRCGMNPPRIHIFPSYTTCPIESRGVHGAAGVSSFQPASDLLSMSGLLWHPGLI